jgi:hypothetical protein
MLIQKREGPFELIEKEVDDKVYNILYLEHMPILYPKKKTFIFEFMNNVA